MRNANNNKISLMKNTDPLSLIERLKAALASPGFPSLLLSISRAYLGSAHEKLYEATLDS